MLRFGANSPAVIDGCGGWRTELYEVLNAGLRASSARLSCKPLIAQALHMGDECHNRNTAATGLLLKRFIPAMLATGESFAVLKRSIEFVAGNDHFFLNLSMAPARPCSSRPQRPRQLDGHRHGPQRRELRHPGQRHGRPVVHWRRPTPWMACSFPAMA